MRRRSWAPPETLLGRFVTLRPGGPRTASPAGPDGGVAVQIITVVDRQVAVAVMVVVLRKMPARCPCLRAASSLTVLDGFSF